MQWVAVCCIVLQGVKGPHCVAVCYCSVLWCAAVYGSVLHRVAIRKGPTLRCSVLRCVAVCCSVLHRVAMRKGPTLCCSVLLQCTPEPHLKHNDLNLPRAYTSNLPRAYKFNLPRAYTFNVPHSHRVPLMAVGTPEPHSIYPIYHTHRILNLPHTPLNVCRSSLSALPSHTPAIPSEFRIQKSLLHPFNDTIQFKSVNRALKSSGSPSAPPPLPPLPIPSAPPWSRSPVCVDPRSHIKTRSV